MKTSIPEEVQWQSFKIAINLSKTVPQVVKHLFHQYLKCGDDFQEAFDRVILRQNAIKDERLLPPEDTVDPENKFRTFTQTAYYHLIQSCLLFHGILLVRRQRSMAQGQISYFSTFDDTDFLLVLRTLKDMFWSGIMISCFIMMV